MLKIYGGKVVTKDGVLNGATLSLEHGIIQAIQHTTSPTEDIRLPDDWLVAPGFIDLHIHGTNGADAMDGTVESLQQIQASLVKEGTTGFLATTMTQSREAILESLGAVKRAMEACASGAAILGVHLEGPYIAASKAGAQPSVHIRSFDLAEFVEFSEASGEAIRIVTFAPELDGADAFYRELCSRDIIASFGHSAASFVDVASLVSPEAIVHGTHLYNQMAPLHHRDPGLPGALLLTDAHYVELIADGVHVADEMLELTYRLKGADRILLITDSIRAKGLPDGMSELGGQSVTISSGEARLEDGTLAGSTLAMNEAFRRMLHVTGCSIEEAVRMTATNAAHRLGIGDRVGTLAPGMDADVVVLDSDYNVRMTLCKGVVVYDNR